jgi:FKBP-type peptidyl-prolyl cis-trans isomerase 2
MITEGSGAKCKPGDWTTIKYKGQLKDGREITNTDIERNGQPLTIALGNRESFHCFDLAIPQLTQGTKVKLACPSYYAYGTAFTWAPVGGEPIPLGSDVDFELEVVECNRTPENYLAQATKYGQPKTTTMQPGRCMYLHSVAAEEEGTPLVITCENEERISAPGFNYFPAVPCYLDEWTKDNKHQEFHYVEATEYIQDFAHEWELCIQAGALALCDWASYNRWVASGYFSASHTTWEYDGTTETIQHPTDYGASYPYVEHTSKWSDVYIDSHTHQDATPLDNVNAKFRIEYCWKNF